jgi:pectate lyase
MGSYGVRGNATEDVVTLSDDKSILGLPGAHVNGNIMLNGVKNVIIRNLEVEGPGACDNDCGTAGESRKDAITIVSGTTNVWLDHLDVYDGEDGNTDITKKSDFVTVSWVKFHYTDNSYKSGVSGYSHRFSNLLGGSDSEGSDGKLSVTFFKTWWGEGVAERMPRVRFGKVHVANCLFTSTDAGQNHCVRAGYLANLLVESNVFIGQKKPIDLYDGDYTAVTAKNNLFTNCSGNTAGSGTSFTPPYSLTLSATSGLQAEISSSTSGAGPTLTWSTTSVIPAAGQVVSYAPRVLRDGAREILTNPGESPVTATVWSATGRKLSQDIVLQPGASADLPVVAGMRILKLSSAQGQESRVLSLK